MTEPASVTYDREQGAYRYWIGEREVTKEAWHAHGRKAPEIPREPSPLSQWRRDAAV